MAILILFVFIFVVDAQDYTSEIIEDKIIVSDDSYEVVCDEEVDCVYGDCDLSCYYQCTSNSDCPDDWNEDTIPYCEGGICYDNLCGEYSGTCPEMMFSPAEDRTFFETIRDSIKNIFGRITGRVVSGDDSDEDSLRIFFEENCCGDGVGYDSTGFDDGTGTVGDDTSWEEEYAEIESEEGDIWEDDTWTGFCGDGVCDDDEDCSSCDDCGMCEEGGCTLDSDCLDDGEERTIEYCGEDNICQSEDICEYYPEGTCPSPMFSPTEDRTFFGTILDSIKNIFGRITGRVVSGDDEFQSLYENYCCDDKIGGGETGFCGDGILDAEEGCDDGNNVDGDGCSSSCVMEICGDGVINNGGFEECDDGNIVVGDGCSSACMGEIGGSCGDDGICDDGDICTNDWCEVNDDGEEECVFQPKCGTGNPCTIQECDENTGECGVTVDVEMICPEDDQNSCTFPGYFSDFDNNECTCVEHPVDCSLLNNVSDPCTFYVCNPNGQINIESYYDNCVGVNVCGGTGGGGGGGGGTGYHMECSLGSCISIFGSGDNQCSTSADCGSTDTHMACNSNDQCVSVPGTGSNECSSHSDCGSTDTHMACNDNDQCVSVPGTGSNECSTSADCQGVTGPCGDGNLDAGEQCDDGNNIDGDGCTSNCIIEICGDGVINNGGIEECDDGNLVDLDGCSSTCKNEIMVLLSRCGDGNLDDDEECDDGNNVDGDACSGVCIIEICGDGVINNGGIEECDDGNNEDGDGCSGGCQNEVVPVCGDGILQAGEGCDDGNLIDGDGCNGICLIEVVGTVCAANSQCGVNGLTCDPVVRTICGEGDNIGKIVTETTHYYCDSSDLSNCVCKVDNNLQDNPVINVISTCDDNNLCTDDSCVVNNGEAVCISVDRNIRPCQVCNPNTGNTVSRDCTNPNPCVEGACVENPLFPNGWACVNTLLNIPGCEIIQSCTSENCKSIGCLKRECSEDGACVETKVCYKEDGETKDNCKECNEEKNDDGEIVDYVCEAKCGDEDLCTDDSCDDSDGTCSFTPEDCTGPEYNDQCNEGKCNSGTGKCEKKLKSGDCDTGDSCYENGRCIFNGETKSGECKGEKIPPVYKLYSQVWDECDYSSCGIPGSVALTGEVISGEDKKIKVLFNRDDEIDMRNSNIKNNKGMFDGLFDGFFNFFGFTGKAIFGGDCDDLECSEDKEFGDGECERKCGSCQKYEGGVFGECDDACDSDSCEECYFDDIFEDSDEDGLFNPACKPGSDKCDQTACESCDGKGNCKSCKSPMTCVAGECELCDGEDFCYVGENNEGGMQCVQCDPNKCETCGVDENGNNICKSSCGPCDICSNGECVSKCREGCEECDESTGKCEAVFGGGCSLKECSPKTGIMVYVDQTSCHENSEESVTDVCLCSEDPSYSSGSGCDGERACDDCGYSCENPGTEIMCGTVGDRSSIEEISNCVNDVQEFVEGSRTLSVCPKCQKCGEGSEGASCVADSTKNRVECSIFDDTNKENIPGCCNDGTCDTNGIPSTENECNSNSECVCSACTKGDLIVEWAKENFEDDYENLWIVNAEEGMEVTEIFELSNDDGLEVEYEIIENSDKLHFYDDKRFILGSDDSVKKLSFNYIITEAPYSQKVDIKKKYPNLEEPKKCLTILQLKDNEVCEDDSCVNNEENKIKFLESEFASRYVNSEIGDISSEDCLKLAREERKYDIGEDELELKNFILVNEDMKMVGKADCLDELTEAIDLYSKENPKDCHEEKEETGGFDIVVENFRAGLCEIGKCLSVKSEPYPWSEEKCKSKKLYQCVQNEINSKYDNFLEKECMFDENGEILSCTEPTLSDETCNQCSLCYEEEEDEEDVCPCLGDECSVDEEVDSEEEDKGPEWKEEIRCDIPEDQGVSCDCGPMPPDWSEFSQGGCDDTCCIEPIKYECKCMPGLSDRSSDDDSSPGEEFSEGEDNTGGLFQFIRSLITGFQILGDDSGDSGGGGDGSGDSSIGGGGSGDGWVDPTGDDYFRAALRGDVATTCQMVSKMTSYCPTNPILKTTCKPTDEDIILNFIRGNGLPADSECLKSVKSVENKVKIDSGTGQIVIEDVNEIDSILDEMKILRSDMESTSYPTTEEQDDCDRALRRLIMSIIKLEQAKVEYEIKKLTKERSGIISFEDFYNNDATNNKYNIQLKTELGEDRVERITHIRWYDIDAVESIPDWTPIEDFKIVTMPYLTNLGKFNNALREEIHSNGFDYEEIDWTTLTDMDGFVNGETSEEFTTIKESIKYKDAIQRLEDLATESENLVNGGLFDPNDDTDKRVIDEIKKQQAELLYKAEDFSGAKSVFLNLLSGHDTSGETDPGADDYDAKQASSVYTSGAMMYLSRAAYEQDGTDKSFTLALQSVNEALRLNPNNEQAKQVMYNIRKASIDNIIKGTSNMNKQGFAKLMQNIGFDGAWWCANEKYENKALVKEFGEKSLENLNIKRGLYLIRQLMLGSDGLTDTSDDDPSKIYQGGSGPDALNSFYTGGPSHRKNVISTLTGLTPGERDNDKLIARDKCAMEAALCNPDVRLLVTNGDLTVANSLKTRYGPHVSCDMNSMPSNPYFNWRTGEGYEFESVLDGFWPTIKRQVNFFNIAMVVGTMGGSLLANGVQVASKQGINAAIKGLFPNPIAYLDAMAHAGARNGAGWLMEQGAIKVAGFGGTAALAVGEYVVVSESIKFLGENFGEMIGAGGEEFTIFGQTYRVDGYLSRDIGQMVGAGSAITTVITSHFAKTGAKVALPEETLSDLFVVGADDSARMVQGIGFKTQADFDTFIDDVINDAIDPSTLGTAPKPTWDSTDNVLRWGDNEFYPYVADDIADDMLHVKTESLRAAGKRAAELAKQADECAGKAGGCFLAGTPIMLSDGSFKNIEDISVGDDVKAYDVSNDRPSNEPVSYTFVRKADKYYVVKYREL